MQKQSRSSERLRPESSISENSRQRNTSQKKSNSRRKTNVKKLLKYKMAKIADNSSNEEKPRPAPNNKDLKSIETTQKSLESQVMSPDKMPIAK